MKNASRTLTVVLFTFLLIGCSPSKESTAPQQGKLHRILKNKSWHISAITSNHPIDFNQDGNKSTDIKTQNNPCQNDDVFLFREDNTLQLKDGIVVCPSPQGTNNEGAWSTNDTYLNLKLPNTSPVRFKVETFNKNQVKVSKPSPFPGAKKIVLTYTFTRTESK